MNESGFLLQIDAAGALISTEGKFTPEEIYLINFSNFTFSLIDASFKDLKESFTQRLVMYSRPYVRFENGKLAYISSPACMSEELFYAHKDSHLFLSNSLLRLTEKMATLDWDVAEDKHYMMKNTTSPGKTFFKNISRIIPFSFYEFKEGRLSNLVSDVKASAITFASDKEAYEFFKKSLNLSTQFFSRNGDTVELLFSGGVDSTLLGVIAEKKLHKKVQSFTMRCRPNNEVFQHDMVRVNNVIKQTSWQHFTCDTDYQNADWSRINYYIEDVPLAPHLPFAYDDMYRMLGERANAQVISGQNLDTLYNLGATSRVSLRFSSLAALLRRFYSSQIFLGSVEGSAFNLKNLCGKLLGRAGFLFYSNFKKGKYLYPQTLSEVCYYYSKSQDELPFLPEQNRTDVKKENLTPFEAYQRLLAVKIKEYLMSGPNAFNHACARRYKVQVGLVYGSEILNKFFISNKISLRDILSPKRFVYDYLKELDADLFASIVAEHEDKTQERPLKIHDWFKLLCDNSVFTSAFATVYAKALSYTTTTRTDAQRFNMLQSYLWRDSFVKRISPKLNVAATEGKHVEK